MLRAMLYLCALLCCILMAGSVSALHGCGQKCHSNDDCQGRLACMKHGKCADDPTVGTQICSASSHAHRHSHTSSKGPKSSSCKPSSYLVGTGHKCNQDHFSDCCKSGVRYPQFHCSPPVSSHTAATLTINGFAKGDEGGGPSECDGNFHKDSELIVALSTGWFNNGKRCGKKVRIFANGRSVEAKVVDECDSVKGCDEEHDFQPPCGFDMVDASPQVWKDLGISQDDPDFGFKRITWTDA